jgi:Tfp pilus assembly protein PilX
MILHALRRTARRAHRRLRAEHGFTMIVALNVMLITSLLVAAVLVAVSGDANITRHDLDGKRAYSAARAGLNAFLYNLDQNPNYWSSCTNDVINSPR